MCVDRPTVFTCQIYVSTPKESLMNVLQIRERLIQFLLIYIYIIYYIYNIFNIYNIILYILHIYNISVSYTHLDVYKRQAMQCCLLVRSLICDDVSMLAVAVLVNDSRLVNCANT